MDNWQAFDKYCGVQGILALLVTIAVVAMVASQRPVPPELWSLIGIGWGFYFSKNGTKLAQQFRDNILKGKENG
jgi:hypothetical protein